MYGPSLYDAADPDDTSTSEPPPEPRPDPRPRPGTALTASVETIDNDRAGLTFSAGIVR